VPSGLPAHLQPLADRVPVAIGQRDQTPAQLGQYLPDQPPFAGEADLERVFEHHRQQFGGGGAAEDGAAVAGGEQIGQPADVVDVDWITSAWIGATGKRIFRRLACAPSGPASAPQKATQRQAAIDQQRAHEGGIGLGVAAVRL